MLVPVIRRVKEKNNCYIERVFPVDGVLSVKVGDFVRPFEHLGECRFSQNEMVLPNNFKPSNFKNNKKYYYSGSLIGKSKSEKIYASYDGNLILREDKTYVFSESEKKYILLSGVWGKVKSIFDKKSVLLETKTKDILFCSCTDVQVSGELVVFPNPTDVLKKSYLENFAKGINGKIIYIGHFVGLDIVERAIELGASALIAGSVNREVYDFAKNKGFALGIFSGFGKMKTPDNVYKFLSSVPYRFVFFEGDKNILRIPVEIENPVLKMEGNTNSIEVSKLEVTSTEKVEYLEEDKDLIRNIDVGTNVQVLQNPYFGWVGVVDRVSESSIFVRFGLDKNSVEIRMPNFFIVE